MIPEIVGDCVPEVMLLRDRRRLFEAGAVVFHVPTLDDGIDRIPKRPGQTWVAWSMESDVNYPQLADPGFLRRFDLTMTYRRDSDVWVAYLPDGDYATSGFDGIGRRFAEDRAPIVYVASNPDAMSRRDSYVAALMKHIAVDSYGRCLNNRRWLEDLGRPTKLATCSRYPFTLAFENSISEDYVTEKFFDPLLVGSVPVYLGAPNVADFAPGDDCYIDASRFTQPSDLAAHLATLARDRTAYARLHAWRRKDPRPQYLELRERVKTHPLCRLAALMAP